MTFNNIFRVVLVFLAGVCSDFEAWALIHCKKSELLDCVFELGNDDLQQVGFGFAVSDMLLMLEFLLVFL